MPKPIEESFEKIPTLDLDSPGKYYKSKYKMNLVGSGGMTTTVAIPPVVIERKAEEKGITPERFVKTHHAIAIFNGFDGVFITFEENTKKENDSKKPKQPKSSITS